MRSVPPHGARKTTAGSPGYVASRHRRRTLAGPDIGLVADAMVEQVAERGRVEGFEDGLRFVGETVDAGPAAWIERPGGLTDIFEVFDDPDSAL